MTKLAFLVFFLALVGCSTTKIEKAEIKSATFNSAIWKSQAGVGKDATIEATTAPNTDAKVGGL